MGPSYEGRSKNINSSRCINLYPEIDQSGKSVLALHGTPGLELFVNIGSFPVRAMHEIDDIIYAAAGDQLKSINAAGVITTIGTLSSDSGRMSMADNGTQLMAVDGPNGYIYDTSTSTFSKITDADFPGGNTVTFMDGYFVVNKPGTGAFQISALYDGLTWDALDIKSAEGDPDNLLMVLNDHRELWAFGENTIEVYYNSGNADFPFDRIQGAFIEWGAVRWSISKGDNTIFFLGKNKRGRGKVLQVTGYQPQYISTPAIEYQISQYHTIDDAYGYCYTEEGHTFYVLTFPSGNATWVYDSSTKMWHERQSYGIGRHRGNSYLRYQNDHLVSDYLDGKIYKMKMDVYTDNGDTIVSSRRTRHYSDDLRIVRYHNLQVDFEAGIGDSNYTSTAYVTYLLDGSFVLDGSKLMGGEFALGESVNPQAMLKWSDDGGHTWSSEHWTPTGKRGEYGQRARWKRLGRSRDRIFDVTITDPIKRTFIGASVNLTTGST